MWHLQKEIDPRVVSEIKRVFYLKDRYGVESRFALLYTKDSISLKKLSKFLRMSDRVMKVGKYCYFIIYLYANDDSNAYKAAENLLCKLDDIYGNQNSFIALGNFDKNHTPLNILNKLNMIIEVIKDRSYSRVEYDNVLDDI